MKNKHPHISEERLRNLPRLPGVYLMKDKQGLVIYVGKAKNLRARVRSYFNLSDSRQMIQFLVTKVFEIDTLVTENERQALVLESDLIGKYRPRYNVHLKDDKSHLMVRVDFNHEWPRLELVRTVREDGARYFGPFVFSYELRTLMDIIGKSFPLRTCSDRVIYNRVRPCLEYQIKRCIGPCCKSVDRVQYLDWVNKAIAVIEGRNQEVIGELQSEMSRAVSMLEYEEAALIRDRIKVLKSVKKDQPAVNIGNASEDAIGFYREGDRLEFSVLPIRRGRLMEPRSFGFNGMEMPDDEILDSLLRQYYSTNKEVPEGLILPFRLEDQDLLEELLKEKAGKPVLCLFPQRGAKLRALKLAQANAEENYRGRFVSGLEANEELRDLKQVLELEEIPRTIECADISHFQGSSTVASIVFFKDGRPFKERYRHFRLSQDGTPNDFASMEEVIQRHLSRVAEEGDSADLLIIDGGKGQLTSALKSRNSLGLDKPELIAIAKKRRSPMPARAYNPSQSGNWQIKKPERVFVCGQSEAIIPASGSPALNLLERIRNEAHRFAITFHRSQRRNSAFKSALDSIPGVGPKRRTLLLREFGSIANIINAKEDELVSRCHIPAKLAARILKSLKG